MTEQRVGMRQAILRRRTVVLWSAVTAAIVATDWPTDVLAGFWREHALAASVGSGLLILFFGLFVAEGWASYRELRQWERVAQVAFKALGRSVEEVREGLDQLLTGFARVPSSPPFPGTYSKRLARVLAADAQLHRVDAADPAGHNHEERLRTLMDNPDWLKLADEGLTVLRWRHRERIAAWAPPMLATDSLARVLDRVARLNELIDAVNDPIYFACVPPHQAGVSFVDDLQRLGPSGLREVAAYRWDRLVAETISIQEDLFRASGVEQWTNVAGRSRLHPNTLRELDERRSAREQIYVPTYSGNPYRLRPDELPATGSTS